MMVHKREKLNTKTDHARTKNRLNVIKYKT